MTVGIGILYILQHSRFFFRIAMTVDYKIMQLPPLLDSEAPFAFEVKATLAASVNA